MLDNLFSKIFGGGEKAPQKAPETSPKPDAPPVPAAGGHAETLPILGTTSVSSRQAQMSVTPEHSTGLSRAEKVRIEREEKERVASEKTAATLRPNMVVDSLKLSRSSIQELPEGLKVTLRLELDHCAQLKRLPRDLKAGALILSNCTALEELPEGLEVNFLRIDGCSALRTWPESVRVELGSVNAANCAQLEGLPTKLGPLANLDLSNCAKITQLPDGLTVSGWLDIGGSGITSLPNSLHGVTLHWRGVQVTSQIAFFPETLTADQILGEKNVEVRRVMMERMGLENFAKQADAKVLHEDTDPGGPRRLLRISIEGDEDIVCVSVICPSTGRQYMVRVPPHIKTCHQAVAWTAGFDNPNDYKPLVET